MAAPLACPPASRNAPVRRALAPAAHAMARGMERPYITSCESDKAILFGLAPHRCVGTRASPGAREDTRKRPKPCHGPLKAATGKGPASRRYTLNPPYQGGTAGQPGQVVVSGRSPLPRACGRRGCGGEASPPAPGSPIRRTLSQRRPAIRGRLHHEWMGRRFGVSCSVMQSCQQNACSPTVKGLQRHGLRTTEANRECRLLHHRLRHRVELGGIGCRWQARGGAVGCSADTYSPGAASSSMGV